MQVPVGKVSFDVQKLCDNAQAVLESVVKAKPSSCKGRYLKSVTMSSTMGPGVKLDPVAPRSCGVRTDRFSVRERHEERRKKQQRSRS